MIPGDEILVSSSIIRLRYRDRYVYLQAGGDKYGTMTRHLDGLIEFDFSNCEVLRTEPIPLEQQRLLDEGDTRQ